MSDAATATKAPILLQWRVGDVTITRLPECSIAIPGVNFLPDATPEGLARHPWLAPDFASAEGEVYLSFHALAVETPGMKLIVDTCFGEGKAGPTMDGLVSAGDFLAGLAAIGFGRDEVDCVLCTHLHLDHVGWNTIKQDGRWVPTFPNARYLIGRTEFDHWTSAGEDELGTQVVISESVKPVIDAGLVDFVAMDHRLSPELRLVPTTGHTPGHVSLVIESRGERAVITGDMIHHPCQIPNPGWALPFDFDPGESTATRERMLADWEASQALVIGTHFSAPTAGRITTENGSRRFVCDGNH
jgi:glyoxylase-like metal-dependent hydrolase (beta-lactamase superfamily II)